MAMETRIRVAAGISLLSRQILLVALLILLPIASGANAQQAELALDPKVALDAYSALVDQQVERDREALRILAATENARSGDWRRIQAPLRLLGKTTPGSAAVWFARPDGSYFTVAEGRTNQSLKDRAYFPVVMSGAEVTGTLVVSKSSGKRSAIIAVPVRAGGRIIGALGISLAMEKVAAFVDQKIPLPQRVIFYALDPSGQTALYRQSTLLFEFPAQLGSPPLAEAVKQMLASPEGKVHYEFQGAQRTAIFKKSDATGWVYALRW